MAKSKPPASKASKRAKPAAKRAQSATPRTKPGAKPPKRAKRPDPAAKRATPAITRAKPAATRAKAVVNRTPPAPVSSADHPYLHVGHGVSAARKTWGLLVVLRDPLPAPLTKLAVPPALDTIEAKVGERTVVLMHDSDSLQWVVAATYGKPGPRANKGEATGDQWQAFNDDVDATLARLHARHPIAAVIRPIDDEYGTGVSAWHAWSMRELPRYLAFLFATGDATRWYVEHACDLWRGWLHEQPLADQEKVLAALPADALPVLKALGGVPSAEEPEKVAPQPTLEEMEAAWAAIPEAADVFTAFEAAFAHPDRSEAWDLFRFQHALLDDAHRTAARAPLRIDLLRRALASPSCRWPDTHWRPHLVDELVRAGRLDEARAEIGRVVLGANSYTDANWESIVGLCDALERPTDGDAVHRMADRYVTGYHLDRRVPKLAPAAQREQASRVLLELSAEVREALDDLDDDALSNAAFRFEDLCKERLGDAALVAEGARLRAAFNDRRERRLADGRAKLERGEPVPEATLQVLLREAQQGAGTLDVAAAERLARAAVGFPKLAADIAAVAYYAKDQNMDAAIATSLVLFEAPPPPEGRARTAWLQSANNTLIFTHSAKRYEESARLADQVVGYARENPYITHAAACSYAAVGRYDDAFDQVKQAIALGYDHVDRVAVDTDLGPLLARADFQALFAGRKR